jgi:hypothetical protein
MRKMTNEADFQGRQSFGREEPDFAALSLLQSTVQNDSNSFLIGDLS